MTGGPSDDREALATTGSHDRPRGTTERQGEAPATRGSPTDDGEAPSDGGEAWEKATNRQARGGGCLPSLYSLF